ncbi:hypothetical protein ON010_g4653 [Phytophthora cinnamomi]|nr:hypothetical protein ON010_g4653 [Phytophthora cinnamomi]
MEMQIEDVVRLYSERRSVLVQPNQPVSVELPPGAITADQTDDPLSTVEKTPGARGLVAAESAPVDGIADSDTVARH